MNKKLLITIGIILGLAIVVGGFYIASQSQNNADLTQTDTEHKEIKRNNNQKDNQENQENEIKESKAENIDTSNWKTYSSTICGVEFKYPSEYYIQVFNERRDVCNILVSKFQKFNPDHSVSLQYSTTFTDKEDFLNCSPEKIGNYGKGQIKWLIPCDNKFSKRSYEQLLNGNCDEDSIFLANRKKLLQKNGNHIISIRCNTKNTTDAKIILAILRSFEFIPKK